MRNGFRHVKLIIIDEVSMLSSLNLAYIHLRLEELFGDDQWFGGIKHPGCRGYFTASPCPWLPCILEHFKQTDSYKARLPHICKHLASVCGV